VSCKLTGGEIRLHVMHTNSVDQHSATQVNETLVAIEDGFFLVAQNNPIISPVIFVESAVEPGTTYAPTRSTAPTPTLNLLPTHSPSSPTTSPTTSLQPSSIEGKNIPFEYTFQFLDVNHELSQEEIFLISKVFKDSYEYVSSTQRLFTSKLWNKYYKIERMKLESSM
jgi:hypothetical protein